MSANVTSQTKPHPSTTLWRAHLACIGTALWLDRVGVLALTLAFALGLAPLLPLADSDLGLVGVLSTD